jgi:hypothetical protein
LAMQPFNEQAAATFKISASNDWHWHWQGLALPALPPTTPEAWQYLKKRFIRTLHQQQLMKSWNWIRKLLLRIGTSPPMGKNCFYITTEVLAPYAKTWKKIMSLCASWEMFQDKIDLIKQSHQIIAASGQQFPTFLTGNASEIQPLQSFVSTNWFKTTRSTTTWSNRRYC